MDIKQKILENSLEVFYKHGFHNSGVEKLAKQSVTTKRTLYAHFGNKDGLIEAVLNYRHDWFMTQLQKSFEDLKELSAKSITQAYIDFLHSWFDSDNFYGCLFINACAEFSDSDTTPHEIARQHKAEVRQFLLAEFIDAGLEQPQRLADTLFVFGEGLIVSAQTGQQDLNWDLSFLDGCFE